MTCDQSPYIYDVYNGLFKIHNCGSKKQCHYCVFFSCGESLWQNRIVVGRNTECNSGICMTNHAEINCLRNFRKIKDKPDRLDMVVIRLSKSGKLGESRPCYHCLKSLAKSGYNIRYVYYSTSDQKIKREKFTDMINKPNTHISSGFRCKHRNRMAKL